VVGHVKELVMYSDIAEEEDFSASLYGFTVRDEVKIDVALKDLGVAARHITSGASEGADDDAGPAWSANESPEVVAAVAARLLYMERFIEVLQSSAKVDNTQKTPDLCRKFRNVGEALLASVPHVVDTQLADGGVDPFVPFINSHLLAPTPPREIESFTIVEAVAFLDTEVDTLAAAAGVARCATLEELEDFYEEFDRRDPGLLCRAKLHTLALGGEHVVGKFPMADLITRSVAAFDVITPVGWDSAALMGDEKVYVKLLTDFYKKGAELMFERLKLYGHNRARRRRKLAKFLPQVHTYFIQASLPAPFAVSLRIRTPTWSVLLRRVGGGVLTLAQLQHSVR
jgi:hypothetical protein